MLKVISYHQIKIPINHSKTVKESKELALILEQMVKPQLILEQSQLGLLLFMRKLLINMYQLNPKTQRI